MDEKTSFYKNQLLQLNTWICIRYLITMLHFIQLCNSSIDQSCSEYYKNICYLSFLLLQSLIESRVVSPVVGACKTWFTLTENIRIRTSVYSLKYLLDKKSFDERSNFVHSETVTINGNYMSYCSFFHISYELTFAAMPLFYVRIRDFAKY